MGEGKPQGFPASLQQKRDRLPVWLSVALLLGSPTLELEAPCKLSSCPHFWFSPATRTGMFLFFLLLCHSFPSPTGIQGAQVVQDPPWQGLMTRQGPWLILLISACTSPHHPHAGAQVHGRTGARVRRRAGTVLSQCRVIPEGHRGQFTHPL